MGRFETMHILPQRDNGQFLFKVRTNSGGNLPGAETEMPSEGWHQIAAVYDSAERSLTLYVDGKFFGTPQLNVPASILNAPSLATFVGASFAANNQGFENVYAGKINEAYVYGKAPESVSGQELYSIDCHQPVKVFRGFNDALSFSVDWLPRNGTGVLESPKSKLFDPEGISGIQFGDYVTLSAALAKCGSNYSRTDAKLTSGKR